MINLSNINLGATLGTIRCQVLDSLPENPAQNIVYVVPNPDSTGDADAFICKIYDGSEFKSVGTTGFDFTQIVNQITELYNIKGSVDSYKN